MRNPKYPAKVDLLADFDLGARNQGASNKSQAYAAAAAMEVMAARHPASAPTSAGVRPGDHHAALLRLDEILVGVQDAGPDGFGWQSDDLQAGIQALKAIIAAPAAEAAAMAATVPAEPIALDHIACIEDGELRFMSGRNAPAYDCELYAMPDGKNAPPLFAQAPVAGQPAEPSPAGDYLDGVNIPELTRALVWLGVATGGQEEMAARLSWYVNQIVSAVLRHKELWSAPKGDSNG